MFYFTIALLLFLIGLTQYIMNKHFNISLQSILVRIFRGIVSPGYYDHYITAAERQKDDLAYAKWLADTQEAHNRHIEQCTRIREAQTAVSEAQCAILEHELTIIHAQTVSNRHEIAAINAQCDAIEAALFQQYLAVFHAYLNQWACGPRDAYDDRLYDAVMSLTLHSEYSPQCPYSVEDMRLMAEYLLQVPLLVDLPEGTVLVRDRLPSHPPIICLSDL